MTDRFTAVDGFTMLEMAAVLSIIGILLLIAVGTWGASVTLVEASACYSNQRILVGAIGMYHAEYEELPTSMDDLSEFVTRLDTAIKCPSDSSVSLEFQNGVISCSTHPPRVH